MPHPINILLVDDERRNLDALEAILVDPGYRLLRAEDAEKALRILLDNDVAAIVLDIKMPVVSGFELAQLIKGTKRFREIPIVFLTAHLLDDQDVITGYGAGGVDYLTKPVNPAILRHKVGVFADLFRKTRALAELNEHLEARVQERTVELQRSEAALRATSEQKDRFLATLAHELRGPLAPLRTGLDILLWEPAPSTTATRALRAMNRQLDHMVRLVDDLLDVSRISRGMLEIRREHVDLGSVIERAIETVDPALKRRDQSVVVDAERNVTAFVDATRVAQVIGNLLSNASRHCTTGAQIRIELRSGGESVSVRVVDHGEGIPTSQLERVFDMFTSVQRSAKQTNDGLGIGLSLSRQIAELHGGTLQGASEGEDKGATFTLTFPVGSPESEVGVRGAPASTSAAGQVLRVVVVEDNDDTADMMVTWLEQLGYEVRLARTGPDGVTAALEMRPDVVVCDVGLPEMDGVEVCRRIVSTLPVPPVMVALTGWGMDGDRKRTIDAGFHHHLVKPVPLDELRAILQSIGRSARKG